MAAATPSRDDNGDGEHLAHVAEMVALDRELRFRVLEAAVFVEHEFLAIAASYLGGNSEKKQELVESLIVGWGGMRAATGILRRALTLHGLASSTTEGWFTQVDALVKLRNQLAHGTTESWQANPPQQLPDGRIGRELRTRTRSGEVTKLWIDFHELDVTVRAGRDAAVALCRLFLELGP